MKDKGLSPSQEAHDFLSPYLIPLTIEGLPLEVDALWQSGHVTVIRLPLDGGSKSLTEEAVSTVREQLKELDARSVLFLSNVERIVIEIDGNQRILERSVNKEVEFPEQPGFRHQHILVGESEADSSNYTTREFHIWNRDLGGENDPKKAKSIRAVVKHLPNRWPEVHQVKLGVAIEEASFADKGRFVIFLPTEMKTGTGTHINAPFYGSLSRQHIEFDDPYNEFLLNEVLNLILDVTFSHLLESQEEWSARAVIDLFASLTYVDGQDWKIMENLINQSDQRGIDLNEIKLILCDQGWCNAENAREMPNIPEDSSIESDQWRAFARFEIISTALEGRLSAVKKLIESLDGSFEPTQSEWLETVNNIAKAVRDGEINLSWDDFLNSLVSVLPSELKSEPRKDDPLSNARILPDQDGCLHSASDDIKLFFQPVQGVDETPEFVEQIPQSIKCRVAFLHPDVNTQQKGHKTSVQKFLDGRFVRSFLRLDLIREVVLPAIPDLPVPHDCTDAKLCSDVLAWVLQILSEKPSEEILSQLAGLPVACYSGWIRMDEAAFGPGWSDCQGEDIWLLAERLPKDKAERLRGSLLLPPEDSRWGVAVGHSKELFRQMGVFDGLRLNEAPEIQFQMQEYGYKLPTNPPSEIPQTSWGQWCHAVHYEAKPYYTSEFQYSLTGINTLSEIYFLDTLDKIGRRVLSNILLASIAQWPSNWDQVTVKKTSGIPWSKPITSPLKYWLKTHPWLIDGTDDGKILSDRWLIPTSILRGQEERYRHLNCLSLELSSRLEKNEVLSLTLIEIGVNVFPVDNNRIGPALLEALASIWSSNKVPNGRFDLFLGQLRHAWRHLDPEKEFPKKFLIRTGNRSFEAHTCKELANVYLPDHRDRTQSLREYQIPILEMHPQDANRLASELLSKTNIKLASKLTENIALDGTIWAGVSENLQSIEDSSYASWLPITLLAIAAYGGQNPTGTTTRRWNYTINRLRRTQIIFAENIVSQLMDKDNIVAKTVPAAEWLSGDVLAIRQDTVLQHEKLATATQKLLDRNDLIKDLRLVLGTLANCENPSHDMIEEALKRAEIDTQEFSEIKNLWTDSLTTVLDRIRPVLMLLGIPYDEFDTITDRESLTDWLESNVPQWPVSDLLSAARKSQNDQEMGLYAWKVIGDDAQLAAWNEALIALGEGYESIENYLTQEQTEDIIASVTPLFRCLARHIAINEANSNLFQDLEAVIRNFKVQPDWINKWWEVPFIIVMNSLFTNYVNILGSSYQYLKKLIKVTNIDELQNSFQNAGIETECNPYDIARKNKKDFEKVITELYDLYRTWIEIKGANSNLIQYPDLPEKLNPEAYLKYWTETELFHHGLHFIGDCNFIIACEGCNSLDDIRQRLELDQKKVEKQRKKRIRKAQEKKRQQYILIVAGLNVELGTTNPMDLVPHLHDHSILTGPDVSHDTFTELASPPTIQ
ncbi:MAG: hypothetical protein OXI24_04455, partial [Candidatus Poribacteria bacterium]|nr:hypothetical protein [Candidatus Poribacteria bacterium]